MKWWKNCLDEGLTLQREMLFYVLSIELVRPHRLHQLIEFKRTTWDYACCNFTIDTDDSTPGLVAMSTETGRFGLMKLIAVCLAVVHIQST